MQEAGEPIRLPRFLPSRLSRNLRGEVFPLALDVGRQRHPPELLDERVELSFALEAHDALNQGVSRYHAKLTVQGGQVYVEDLKTANYTNLRGQRLQPGQKYPLNNGDELILGRLRLVYYAS